MRDEIKKAMMLSGFQVFVFVALLFNVVATIFLLNLAITQYGQIATLENQVKTNSITSSINSQLLSRPENDNQRMASEEPRSLKESLAAAKEGSASSHFNKAWLKAHEVSEDNKQVKQLIELHKERKALALWRKKNFFQKLAIIIQQSEKEMN